MLRRLLDRVFGFEVIGDPQCAILHRWTLLEFGRKVQEGSGPSRKYKLLLHRFLANVDDRAVHDHPRAFVTLVLRGSYDDVTICPACWGPGDDWPPTAADCQTCGGEGYVREGMRVGSLRYRPALHRHRTRSGPAGCWTLVLMGPIERPWGFWEDGKWMPWRKFQELYGHGMRCPD